MTETNNLLDKLKRLETVKKNQGNWLDRIKNKMQQFHNQNALVHPCVINGKQTLVYPKGLDTSDPRSFRLLQDYAKLHRFVLKEDQRADFIEGVKRVNNKHLANVVSVMALAAGLSLMSQNTAAANLDDNDNTLTLADDLTTTQIIAGFDLDFDSYQTDEDLANGLLEWLNHHSTFKFQIDEAPQIKKVSALEIAQVAFGGELPQAVNPESLQLFGLYNFNEETVYLLDSVDLNTTEGKGILLHELVHYLQYQTGVSQDAACMSELEALAYTLEARFLDAHEHAHSIDQTHISQVSECKI